MGNLIFGTTTIQGRTFDDIKIQTSKAGVPRPIIFGTARPVVGNIIATTAPRIEKTKEEQGGKGGPSVEVENEEIFRTYAIRICEGPVTGISRVWRNNELVYERDSEDSTQIENNTAFLEKVEFFLGSYTQMPSAVMQSAFGMSNVHAYRGTCYMVVDDENLTATGGAIPQYAFEVERCEGFALTSRPYSIETRDSILAEFSTIDAPPAILEVDSMGSEFLSISGNLNVVFVSYGNYAPEAVASQFANVSGDLITPLVSYNNYDPEAVYASFESIAGDLNVALIVYSEYDPEEIYSEFLSITGDLT